MGDQSFPLWWPWWLNQNDFFTLSIGSVGTAYSLGAYNQSAYIGNVQMRQAQLYQKKNYHLAWVAIARDDIRSMMNLSVLRINNYMVISTLLLGIASSYLVTPIDGQDDVENFIVNSTNVSIAVSVMYFAVAIMLSVQGQNSAFSNTVRLLTWEVRPENPAQYDHNYMDQAQRFETWRNFFRWPGRHPTYAPLPSAESTAEGLAGDESASGSNGEGLEHVEPPTRELFYLARYGRFMQLWQPLDSNAKYCIGLGLSSMSQGAAYWSLGRLVSGEDTDGNDLLASQFVIIFVYLSCLVLHSNLPLRGCRRGIAYALFASGPFFACLAVWTKHTFLPRIFVPLMSTSHSLLYLAVLYVSRRAEASPVLKDAIEHTKVFTRGMHGQEFDRHAVVTGSDHAWDGSVVGSSPARDWEESSGQAKDPLKPKGAVSELEQHAAADVDEDGYQAHQVARAVRVVMRSTLWVSALVWICITFTSLLQEFYLRPNGASSFADAFRISSTASRHLTPVSVDIDWPTAALAPRSLTCLEEQVFLATKFSVFQLDIERKKADFVPCPPSSLYADIATRCETNKLCDVWVLTSAGKDKNKEQHMVNCRDGKKERIFTRGSGPIERFQLDVAVERQAYALQNVSSERATMSYIFLTEPTLGWVPRWEVAEDPSALDIDSNGSHVFYFTERSISAVSLADGSSTGSWTVPPNVAGKMVSGCVYNSSAFLALTDSRPPTLLYLVNSARCPAIYLHVVLAIVAFYVVS